MSAEIKIRMSYNDRTGQKEIKISYEGENDELPIEHERKHRAAVKELLGEGILNPDDQEKVRVDRTLPVKEGPGKRKTKPKSLTLGDSGGNGGLQEKAKA